MRWFKRWMEETETTLEVEQHFTKVKLIHKFSFGHLMTYVYEAEAEGQKIYPVISRWKKYVFRNAFEELICAKLEAKINAFVLIQVLKQRYPESNQEFTHIEMEIGLPDKFKELNYEIIAEPHSSGHFLKLALLPQAST